MLSLGKPTSRNGQLHNHQVIDMVYSALEVWDEGMTLASLCYDVTTTFPTEHSWVLKTKIRLASSRVAANVAEGYEQSGEGFWHCIQRAQESLLELKTHLRFAERLALVEHPVNVSLLEMCDGVAQGLASLQAAA